MTKRSILAGSTPTVIIKAGTSVTVEGWDSDRVHGETHSRGGLNLYTRSEAEIGRARAAVGEHVLFDLRLKWPTGKAGDAADDAIEVQIGADGVVRVPYGSRVKVFAGMNVDVSGIQGDLAVYAGGNARVHGVRALAHGSAGGGFDLDCETLDGNEARIEAGGDLRCYIRDLTSARVIVSDLGGPWEGVIGAGEATLRLKAGRDATLVTDQKVEPVGPEYILGQIERPQG